jgi:hypothetical protein
VATINLNKTITALVAVSGTWTLTLSDVDGILVGMRVDVKGLNTPSWNQTYRQVTAVNTTLKTITYVHSNTTVAQQDITEGIVHLDVEWVDVTFVANILGYTPSGGDLTFLEYCVDAANDFGWLRRQEAGYADQPGVAPGGNAQLGTGLYAMSLYRERGSVDSFSSFEQAPTPGTFGTMGQINKLLGIPRSQIA